MERIKNKTKTININKYNWPEICYLILAAFVILSFASRSSFLYPCNDWNDANSYFSVGKGLFNGKVPYRDIFDQKGMYLYFFYGLAYLISHTTFLGVFLLEWVLAAADLFGIHRILRLYVKKETALVLAPLALAVSFSSRSFYWGGSAEEMCLPFLVWGLYLSLRHFKEEYPAKTMDFKTLFLAGILAGMVANIKFTVLGFFFAWMMCIAFSFLARKDFPGAVKACLVFLGSMAVTFLPWVIYFAVNHALYYWYWGYVYINVFAYSNLNGEGPGIFERVYTLAKQLYWIILANLNYFVFVIPGVFFALADKSGDGRRRFLPGFNIFALCFFLFLGIYVGGSDLPYYALPLSVFTVLGFAVLGKFVEWLSKKTSFGRRKKAVTATGCVISLCVCAGFIYAASMNTPYMQVKREDHFLYKLKQVVEQKEDPTLLNIGCLDAGLYTVCDIVPTCQWFQTQTVIMDTVLSEQERYIREGQIDFVLARDAYPDVIWEQYELAAEEKWQQDEMEFTYYLFRKKGGN
ncbi:MAG: hypothetical protein ACI4SD_05630 [Suilimivivens sp.]